MRKISESSLRCLKQRRYEIAPQMRHYDLLEKKSWIPYVMIFQPSRLTTPSFATDEHGFRCTLWDGGVLSLDKYNTSALPRAALIGSSAAFGVGASCDARSLASLLNGRRTQVWFNFAGRGFNSTQELLIFLLHLPPSLKTVLIFSGVNNLVLSYLSQSTSPIYNSFYAQSEFQRGLRSGGVTGVRGSLRLLLQEIGGKLFASGNGTRPMDEESRYRHVLACFERDLRLWALLRDALGFSICFVFQPVVLWMGKRLTCEEEELSSLLDRMDMTGSWDRLRNRLLARGDRYRSDVRGLCEGFQIPFLDLNDSTAFTEERWLFVDRAHLNDEGYALAAQEISRQFPL